MSKNLIRQLVSVEKYTYAQVSNYLKTKYPKSWGFSERTVRRYCKENEISSRTDTNEVNRMVPDAVSQVKLRLSVINFLFVSIHLVFYFCCALLSGWLLTSCENAKNSNAIYEEGYLWYCSSLTQILGFSQTKSLQVNLLFLFGRIISRLLNLTGRWAK